MGQFKAQQVYLQLVGVVCKFALVVESGSIDVVSWFMWWYVLVVLCVTDCLSCIVNGST